MSEFYGMNGEKDPYLEKRNKVKKYWTKQEVIAFAKKYADRCQAPIQAGDGWIEANLK